MNNTHFRKSSHLRTMQKATSFLLAAFFLTAQFSTAQYFERIYPGLNLERIGTLDNTIDSGFIVCGTQSGGFLMKLNAGGDTEWTKTDNGDLVYSNAVIQNAAGNYVAIGSGSSQQYNSLAVVSTYDAAGVFLSDTVMMPDGWGTAGISITRSPDRSYSHYWYYSDGLTADNHTFLDNGNVIGGDITTVRLNSVSMNDNGQYAAAGNLLFDMDTAGVWHNNILHLSGVNFGYYYFDTDFSACSITADGGVLVAGIYDTLSTTFLRMIKITATGSVVWDNFITDTTLTFVNDIKQTADGGFAILCSANDGSNHIAFLEVDSLGTLKWKKDFYGYGIASPINFKILEDGFVILGSSNGDPYIIRTDSMGSVSTSTNVTTTAVNANSVSVFPNPSNGTINISFDENDSKEISLSVFDLSGRVVFNEQLEQTTQQLNLSFLAKGIYQIKFTSQSGELKSDKLVIE